MLGILSNAWTIKISDNIITNKLLEQQKSFLIRYNGIAMDFNKTTTDNLLKIRKIKHDFNNSIQTIKSLIDNNNFDEASKLATELEQKYNEITINNKYCNNSILDAIIQQNKDICSNYDITLNINCSMPESIPIKSIDICSIANNMLQNSIEAVKSIDDISKRNIDFSVWIEKHMIFFKTVNPKTHNIKKVGNKILTSKKTDTQNHGLGLEIIEDIAKSYNGKYTIEYDDTSFILIVYLNIS